jgi:hypothetical protein
MAMSYDNNLFPRLVVEAARHRRIETSSHSIPVHPSEFFFSVPNSHTPRHQHHRQPQNCRQHEPPPTAQNPLNKTPLPQTNPLITMADRSTTGSGPPEPQERIELPHRYCPCETCAYVTYNNTAIGLMAVEQMRKEAADARFWKSLCGTLITAGIFYFTWRRANAP